MGIWLLRVMLYSLMMTEILELIFALIYGIRNKKDLCLVLLVNILTNPVVVLSYELMDYYTLFNPIVMTVQLELAAILIEGSYFKRYGENIRKPMVFAFCINLFSYGIGWMIAHLI